MVDKKISELTNITGANLADADEFVVVDTSANETKAITYAELKSGLDTSTGFVRVTGDTMTGNLSFGDNNKAIFGAGSDLQIYHDGLNSYVTEIGTGNLFLRGTNLALQSSTGFATYLDAVSGGATTIYHNGAAKLATTSTGVDVTGTVTADGLTVDGNITSTGGDLNLATLDLNAIAASKAVTAVDVFVYDTSKDSDGGAWRKRTQHTSWYNETLNTATRGSRREFPAVAVIVAQSGTLTIYDGDDPSLPMWIEFKSQSTGSHLGFGLSGRACTSVSAVNGSLIVGRTSDGAFQIDFIADRAIRYGTSTGSSGVLSTNIANRNATPTFAGGDVIVNSTVNDVAMTVLPNAPIDPATGLPVPTIAVATAGGVSVIKDDGTVVDLVNYVTAPPAVSFVDVGGVTKLHTTSRYSNWINVFDIPDADFNTGPNIWSVDFPTNGFASKFSETKTSLVSGWSKSLVQFQKDEALTNINGGSTANRGVQVVNYITSTYNTGWMNGDIKGAFLSSTDTASLVGSGELVTNGTFDTDTSGWTAVTPETVISHSSGRIRVASTTAGAYGKAQFVIPTVIGQTYTISLEGYAGTGSPYVYVGSSAGASNYGAFAPSAGPKTFTALTTSTYITLYSGGAIGAFYCEYDNISVKLADADRSVNNKGLIVNGTVTRSPVATGAELVAYSGFSSSNYLEQPYNSALDFGTGDFCVMGWVNFNGTTGSSGILQITDKIGSSYGTKHLAVWLYGPTNELRLRTTVGASVINTSFTIQANNSVWQHVVVLRKSGVVYAYVNGVLAGSIACGLDFTFDASYVSLFGVYWFNGAINGSGALKQAFTKVSATAPTAEQIKKIYEDEKVLFQENAAATLYGTSDAVTALAHDEDTGLLHVGTSAGRSVFQGLRRVSNTTTAVGTAISASNSLVVEE